MSKLIEQIDRQRMTRKVPDFKPGDTVVVQVKVVEGDREALLPARPVGQGGENRGKDLTGRRPDAGATDWAGGTS